MHLPQSSRAGWSPHANSPPPERSNPLRGENLINQVRELRRNSRCDALCPSALGTSFLVRKRLEPPTGGKTMRAAHPHTPRQERITCSRRTSLPFLNVSQIASLRKKIFSIFSFPPLDKTKDLIIIKDRTRLTGQSLKREKR